MASSTLDNLIRIALAPICVACRLPLERPLRGPVCDGCWCRVVPLTPPLCTCCGDRLHSSTADRCGRCERNPPHFSLARSAGLYEGGLREMIHAFKYDRRRVLASHLASMVTGAAGSVLDDADAVVPVPLHPWRAVARGFNQADDLAQHFKRPVWRVLRRARRGLRQAVLAEHVRETNVRGAFHARSIAFVPFPAIVRKRLKGATVVVIDDVMTTGATLDACSYALREAGVKDVRALTVARSLATMPR